MFPVSFVRCLKKLTSDAEIRSLSEETCRCLLRRSRLSYQMSLGATQSQWVTWSDLMDRLLVTVSLHDVLITYVPSLLSYVYLQLL